MKKKFRRLLEDLDLVKGQVGTDRKLYFLRQTYATQELFGWHRHAHSSKADGNLSDYVGAALFQIDSDYGG